MKTGEGWERDTLAFREPRVLQAAIETGVATAILPLIGALFRRSDPYFLESELPLLFVAPLFPALRYGFAHGFACAAILGVGITIEWSRGAIEGYPVGSVLGLVALAMLAGEFSDAWKRRWSRAWTALQYAEKRLAEFTPRYHLLKASHDRLEKRLAGSTQSLRTALQGVRGRESEQDVPTMAQIGDRILEVLSTYCSLQVASVFEVKTNSEIVWPACATLGHGRDVPRSDPMLEESLLSVQMLSVHDGAPDSGTLHRAGSNLLAAIPVADAFNHVWAIVAIQQMPFIAFQEENLRMLAVLASAFGDQLTVRLESAGSDSALEQEFRLQLRRSIHHTRDHELPSALVQLKVTREFTNPRIIEQIVLEKRGLDCHWLCESPGGDLTINLLMPLTGALGASGYVDRLERMLRARHGKNLEEAGIAHRTREVTPHDSVDELMLHLQGLREDRDPEPTNLIDRLS